MGFYYKKILEDKATTIGLIVDDKEWTCPLTEGLNVSTQVNWESGGGLIDAFQKGIAEGANSAMDMARGIQNIGSNIGNRITGGNSKGGVSFNGAEQGRLVTGGGDYYKKFKDSQTDFNLPTLTFTFLNIDDTDKVIKDAEELMECLLPLVSESSNNDYRYEMPPNNFQTPNQGFDPSNITGSVSVRIGTRTIKYFVPISVNMRMSADCSLVDNNIPQSIDVTVSLTPAYKYMSPDVFAIHKKASY